MSPFYNFSATLVCVSVPVMPRVCLLSFIFHVFFLVNGNNEGALWNFVPARTPGRLRAPVWPLISFLWRIFNESLKPVEIPSLEIHLLDLTTFLSLLSTLAWSVGQAGPKAPFHFYILVAQTLAPCRKSLKLEEIPAFLSMGLRMALLLLPFKELAMESLLTFWLHQTSHKYGSDIWVQGNPEHHFPNDLILFLKVTRSPRDDAFAF